MKLRKRIAISNVLMVLIPVLVTVALWACFVFFGIGFGLKPLNRTSDGADFPSHSQSVVNVFEAELSYLTWDMKYVQGYDGLVPVFEPNEDIINELDNLGYHLQVESSEGLLYSNMDRAEVELLRQIGSEPDGAVVKSGDCIVIQNSYWIEGQLCRLTAIYDEERADSGIIDSFVPMYLVSPQALFALLAAAMIATILTALFLTRRLNRSVLEPLDELKAAADRIADDDLEGTINYSKDDEFGEVCEAFDNMRVRLKDAEAEKARYEDERRELLQGISHDLRSPLTSIKGYAYGLKDGVANTEEKKQRYYDAIITRSEDLERLTDRLSLLTQLEDGGKMLQLEQACIKVYIGQIVDDKGIWFADNQVNVTLHMETDDVEVLLDRAELRRVFDNLFENTVRYRDAASSNVTIASAMQEDHVRIDYLDDGPGVPEEHLPNLFDSFYRVDESRTKPEQGSGLGLAIVKRIVEGHGGTVSAYCDGGLGIAIELPTFRGDERE